MTLRVHLHTLGALSTNCYIVGDSDSGDAVIIDPASDAPIILQALQHEQWLPRYILLTHAHFDHIMALREVKDALNIPILMHRADVPLLEGLSLQTQLFLGEEAPPPPPPDQFVEDGDVIEVGTFQLEVRFTPGHAPGHVIYICHDQGICFSGDCVFAGSVGRTGAIPGTSLFDSDHATLMRSIFAEILTLPDAYTLAPGHGTVTTVGEERANNPFIIEWANQHR